MHKYCVNSFAQIKSTVSRVALYCMFYYYIIVCVLVCGLYFLLLPTSLFPHIFIVEETI